MFVVLDVISHEEKTSQNSAKCGIGEILSDNLLNDFIKCGILTLVYYHLLFCGGGGGLFLFCKAPLLQVGLL